MCEWLPTRPTQKPSVNFTWCIGNLKTILTFEIFPLQNLKNVQLPFFKIHSLRPQGPPRVLSF